MILQKPTSWTHREPFKAQNSQNVFSLSADEKLSVMEALDHMHVTRQYQEMGSCSVCKKISLKKCSACGTFYCSSECQTYDWPKHSVVCSRQRDSTSDRNSLTSNKHTIISSFKKGNNENLMATGRTSPFAVLSNQLGQRKDSSTSKSVSNYKIGNKQYQSRDQSSIKSRETVTDMRIDARDSKKNSLNDKKYFFSPKKTLNGKKKEEIKVVEKGEEKKRNGSVKSARNNQNEGKAVKTSWENIAECGNKKKSPPISPKKGKIKVIGTYRESPQRYWVLDVNDLEEYEKIQNQLNNNCENFATVTPRVGLLCCCIYEDEWFRAEVMSLTPVVTIHFVDYGNTANYSGGAFRKLPDNLLSIRSLAFLIEFAESSSYLKTADLDSVKFFIEKIGVCLDGVPRVKTSGLEKEAFEEEIPSAEVIKNEETEEKTIKKKYIEEVSPPSNGSVVDALKRTSKGMLLFLPGEGTTRYGSLVPEDNKNAEECIEKVLNIENRSNEPIEADEGDYVLVIDKEGNDQRGKVLSNVGSTYYVQLVDCGNVISTDCVYPLSKDLKQLVELGVKVTIEEIVVSNEIEKLESCVFAITGECKAGKWPATLKDNNFALIANISLEKPTEGVVWQPRYHYIKSGATVEISSSTPPNTFYIRAVDVETEQKFLHLNMELIQSVPKAKNFAIPPMPGDLCCAKFLEDGCYYRAIVNSFDGGKANILFIDFGNEQETELNDLKQMSMSLRNFPFFAVKVKLNNISGKPWNNMIKEYIGKLTSENVELTLIYEGDIKNGVTLREKVSGVVVNDFIEKTRDRSRMSQSMRSGSELSTRTEIFLDDDMEYTTVAEGTKCDLAVLYVSFEEFEKSYTFWGTVAGVKNFEYVNSELNSLICDHCSHVSTPYEPSYRELCLAEFEGSWYRAICAGKNENGFKVVFIDFGNMCEVKATSIRKMVKKFMKAPALAMNCTVTGHEKMRNNPELLKRVCGMLLDKLNTCFVGVEVSKFKEDTYLLKIPEIEKLTCG